MAVSDAMTDLRQLVEKLRLLGKDCQNNPITVPNLSEQLWDIADARALLVRQGWQPAERLNAAAP